mgnify:FL=1
MKTVVISQPMYFPWVGMLEQMRMADVYVHLDDAQFSKGGFFNRVQVKTGQGTSWLTVPLAENKLGQPLNEIRPAAHDWRRKHLATLNQAYAAAPHSEAAVALMESVLEAEHDSLASLSAASMEALADYFGILPAVIQWASRMDQSGTGTERVLAICRALGAERYISGHGGRAYLDHAAFDAEGIRVEYVEYKKKKYPQLHGAFTPHVSALDLVANAGPDGLEVIASGSVYWKNFPSRDTV